MTCCVASLCDDRKAIVFAADKMVGMGMIESEPNIKKILRVHRDWWVMLAGNDVSPAFDIVDNVKRNLAHESAVSVELASQVVSESYKKKRAEIAEATYLVPLGWTLKQFNSRSSIGVIPDATRTSIGNLIANYCLSFCLLVAGFNSHGQGHLFSVDDDENRGDPRRHDIPGYHAIGSGGYGATYMMAYRELSPVMPIREVLYYASGITQKRPCKVS
jgi:20S proteasome alpha/beta subunit